MNNEECYYCAGVELDDCPICGGARSITPSERPTGDTGSLRQGRSVGAVELPLREASADRPLPPGLCGLANIPSIKETRSEEPLKAHVKIALKDGKVLELDVHPDDVVETLDDFVKWLDDGIL